MLYYSIPVLFFITFVDSKTCTPPQTTFYWKSPCDGQKFQNQLTVTNLTITQNGVSVDKNGGLNMELPIDEVITGANNYGSVAKPLIDIDIYHYTGVLTCDWEKEPLGNKLNNIDACTIIQGDCHMSDPSVTTITASINLKDLLGSYLDFTVVGDYYALAVTTLDGTKPIQCFWAQDKVIAK